MLSSFVERQARRGGHHRQARHDFSASVPHRDGETADAGEKLLVVLGIPLTANLFELTSEGTRSGDRVGRVRHER